MESYFLKVTSYSYSLPSRKNSYHYPSEVIMKSTSKRYRFNAFELTSILLSMLTGQLSIFKSNSLQLS